MSGHVARACVSSPLRGFANGCAQLTYVAAGVVAMYVVLSWDADVLVDA